LLLSGLAFRHKTLRDGRRQIMSFHVPGEICDMEGLLLAMDHSVSALSRAEVSFIPHTAMEALLDSNVQVARALWRTELVENAIAREWMVGMGRRSAYARIAHLFCEMYARLRAVGLVEGARCWFPITQTHLSDALGLSVVHTNRVLQALRAEGLLSFRAGLLTVHDWPGLKAAGEFDPGYLHLKAGAV
jgi:CRP-like cAMP-binding protein